jgi:hypothetical protein
MLNSYHNGGRRREQDPIRAVWHRVEFVEPATPECHEIDFGIVLRAEFKGFLEERLHTPPASRMSGFRRPLLLETSLHGCVHCTVVRGVGSVTKEGRRL